MNDIDKSLGSDLLNLCIVVLKQMSDIAKKLNGHLDVEHNLTWTGTVFPGIHGLLLGAAFSIYHFSVESSEIIEEANECMINSNFIHPYIKEALSLLSHAKHKDDRTCDGLRNCCFLVPIPSNVKFIS